MPSYRSQPKQDRGSDQDPKDPSEAFLDEGKRQMNERGEQEYNVNRVGKPLLVFGVARQRWIKGSSVISGLNFAGNFGTIRITVVKDQFAGSEPARIQVGKISARSAVGGSIGLLILDQHALHIKPHATCHQNRQQQTEFGSIQQYWKRRIDPMLQLMPQASSCACEF
jgi:hypothetical protein